MKQYGLLGRKLGHSHSPSIHHQLYGYAYELLPMEPETVGDFLIKKEFDGLNVTIPYKQTVIPYLDELTQTAQRIGAVNTIVKREDGSLLGDNTDVFGFSFLAQQQGINFHGQKTVILGSGGTSLMVQDVVKRAGGTAVVISRRGENHYGNLHLHADTSYVVNTTPVGMFPSVDACPVDLSLFPKLKGVLDVIYNPLRTLLLQEAIARGIPCAGGMTMLVAQAAKAGEQFAGEKMNEQAILRVTQQMERKQSNVVLVGMPGCGKTSIGKKLARELGLRLVDIDAKIVEQEQMSIPMIFETRGEAAFRQIESEVIQRVSLQTGQVIACGGGAVLKESNRQHLRMNGVVLYLKRELSALATKGRPLSTDLHALEALYATRAPLYQACADVVIDNNESFYGTVRRAMRAYQSYFGEGNQ